MKLIFETKGLTMLPAVSRRYLKGEVPVRSQVSPREICSGQVGLGKVFLRVLPFSPVSIIPFMLYTHLYLHVAVKGGQKGEAWEPSEKASALPSRAAIDSKVVSIFSP